VSPNAKLPPNIDGPRNPWATVESEGPPSRIKKTPRLRIKGQGAGGLGRVASCWVQG